MLWSQKNAALEDLEIWKNIEKLHSNQEPRLSTSDTSLMSVVPTQTVQGLIVSSCCLDPIVRNSVLSSLNNAAFHHAHRLLMKYRTLCKLRDVDQIAHGT